MYMYLRHNVIIGLVNRHYTRSPCHTRAMHQFATDYEIILYSISQTILANDCRFIGLFQAHQLIRKTRVKLSGRSSFLFSCVLFSPSERRLQRSPKLKFKIGPSSRGMTVPTKPNKLPSDEN